ncbi:hypothetical protein [Roseimaritima sediminicola]|uniref:hypothetical protein n=1 Tax=Roseimaritima sediminicola TaxID=2662066 RepID=UPI0012982C0E|nr:hypothetical protein [Roseimaritima sediminicola]
MLMPNPDPDLNYSFAAPQRSEAVTDRARWLGQRQGRSSGSNSPFRVIARRSQADQAGELGGSKELAGQLVLIALFALAVALQSMS